MVLGMRRVSKREMALSRPGFAFEARLNRASVHCGGIRLNDALLSKRGKQA